MILKNCMLTYPSVVRTGDTYLFTGNSIVKRDGALVMGAGAAKCVRDLYPGVDKLLGQVINGDNNYGLRFIILHGGMLGVFQTKREYNRPSTLEILDNSVRMLKRYAEIYPNINFHLNFPCVGYGGMEYSVVQEIVKILPDNVILYLMGKHYD